MEGFARAITIRMGGVTYIAEHDMSGATVKRTAVTGTLSLALRLGQTLRVAREEYRDSIQVLTEAPPVTPYQLYKLATFDGDSTCEIAFQNEYLVARVDGRVATVVTLAIGLAAFGLDETFVLLEKVAEPVGGAA